MTNLKKKLKKKKKKENSSMEELAREHLEELIDFLSSESELTPIEIMNEVGMLIDNYRSEINLKIAEEEQEAILNLADENDEDGDPSKDEILLEAIQKLSSSNFNRGFLLSKATDLYYKKIGLDVDSFSELSPADKVIHRKGITKVFNDLVIKEAKKPAKSINLSGGAIKRKRATEAGNDEASDLDEGTKTEAEIDFYKEKIKEFKKLIRMNKAEITEAERQNKHEKVSSLIISRNLDRVEELKEELDNNQKELLFYQNKL